MSITTAPPSELAPESRARLTRGTLPKWAPWGLLAASAAIIAAPFALIATVGESGFHLAGWAVCTVLLFHIIIYVVSRTVEGHRKAVDRLVTAVVTTAFGIATLPLISVAFEVIRLGVARLDAAFFTESMRNVSGEGGGALHAIVGTLEITGMATLISVPIGVMTAIYLVEYGKGQLAKGITFLVDVMTGIPSIVAGLFAYALFVIFFDPGIRMGFMGAVALAVLMTPVVVRSTEEMLRLVPNELREASYALGVPKWLTIVKVVLPTAIAGITTGVMLAIARVIGETAPLLITAGFTNNMNYDLFDGRMQTLPVFIYTQYMNQGIPQFAYVDRAWAAALTLIVIVMALNLLARLIARIFAPKTNR